jgi:hypothetical protein
MAVADGRKIPVSDIRGVLSRLPRVAENELNTIELADRGYVASEMSAFLSFWLSYLPCPVLNRPTPGSLNGPTWRWEQWASAAKRVGMEVLPQRRRLSLGTSAAHERMNPTSTVTIIGDEHVSDADQRLIDKSHKLAAATGTCFLDISFSGPNSDDARFLNISLYPDITRPEVIGALTRYFRIS